MSWNESWNKCWSCAWFYFVRGFYNTSMIDVKYASNCRSMSENPNLQKIVDSPLKLKCWKSNSEVLELGNASMYRRRLEAWTSRIDIDKASKNCQFTDKVKIGENPDSKLVSHRMIKSVKMLIQTNSKSVKSCTYKILSSEAFWRSQPQLFSHGSGSSGWRSSRKFGDNMKPTFQLNVWPLVLFAVMWQVDGHLPTWILPAALKYLLKASVPVPKDINQRVFVNRKEF